MADQTLDGATQAEGQDDPQDAQSADTPAIELTPHLRRLRDHLLGAFPALSATAYRGELTVHVAPSDLLPVLAFCRTDPGLACELLSDLSAVHWPAGIAENNDQETTGWPTYVEVNDDGRIEVDYIVRSVSLTHWFRLRTEVPDTDPRLPSATAEYSSANFMEREVFDMAGVHFEGHPNLARIMMPDDWEGHPHRKDYPLGGVEVMYKGHTISPPDERDY